MEPNDASKNAEQIREPDTTISNHDVLLLLIQQNKILLLPCNCLLKWDDLETSLIMCKKHYDDYDNMDMKLNMNYKIEQFIKKLIHPSGSQYSAKLSKELK